MMNRKFTLVSILMILVLSLYAWYYFDYYKNNKSLNIEIPENIFTAKQLFDFSNPHIINHIGKDANVVVGEVVMILDSSHRGVVRITFVEHKPNRRINVFQLHMDTANRVLIKIEELGSSDKVNPGSIALADWKIDSLGAVEKAKQILGVSAKRKRPIVDANVCPDIDRYNDQEEH